MSHPEDNTSETVSRYIQELLEKRAQAVTCSAPSGAPVSETELLRRVESQEFREEMVSRFQRLRQLAKEAGPSSPVVHEGRRRPRLEWLWLVLAVVASPVLCSLAWTALDAVSGESPPALVPAERADSDHAVPHRLPWPAVRAVPGRSASSVVTERPKSAPTGTRPSGARGPSPWSIATEHLRQGLNVTAMALGASEGVTATMEQRVRSRIARMLTDAVNDKILGSAAAASVAGIALQPNAASRRLSLDYVGDVLDGSGQVIGRVSGTYTFDPESLSATVLYEGEDRVEYSANYFKGKF